MRLKSSSKLIHGFTLIELLIAISIIAVLSTIAFVSYTATQRAARDAKRKSDLNGLKIAMEFYYQDNKTYCLGAPVSQTTCSWNSSVASLELGANGTQPDSLKNTLITRGYIGNIPRDPTFNTIDKDYFLKITSPAGYILSASLESTPLAGTNQGCTPEGVRNYCITQN